MSNLVIETRGLRKVFTTRRGRRVAVDGLDLAVPAGGVHGFLGPNGSGKTTTIRMLLGLARPTRGEMALFGQRVPEALPEVIDRIGAVVESPKFAPNFTGRANLMLLARSIGVPRAQVDEALETVSLSGRQKDRYKTYSLGMRQRLAIAATLLKRPDLLILDEPSNGLDPAGIREIRETIRGLAERGVTVLLSSHILAEVQQVCDSATIIGDGHTLASGRVEALLASGSRYAVHAPDAQRAAEVLSGAGFAARLERVSADETRVVVETEQRADTITRTLAEAGVWLTGLTPIRRDLESYFLELTGGQESRPFTPTGDETEGPSIPAPRTASEEEDR